jgi:hypothetical protein
MQYELPHVFTELLKLRLLVHFKQRAELVAVRLGQPPGFLARFCENPYGVFEVAQHGLEQLASLAVVMELSGNYDGGFDVFRQRQLGHDRFRIVHDIVDVNVPKHRLLAGTSAFDRHFKPVPGAPLSVLIIVRWGEIEPAH